MGDVGLALAIFLLFRELGTVQYTEVFARADEISGPALVAIAVGMASGVAAAPAGALAPGPPVAVGSPTDTARCLRATGAPG